MAPSATLGFNGEAHEPETRWQLLGNGYRAYHPVFMRFHSGDDLSPLGDGGINAYMYCGGDPANRADPSGHRGLPFFAFAGLSALSLGTGLAAGFSKDPDIQLIGAVTSVVSGMAGVVVLGAMTVKGQPLYSHLLTGMRRLKGKLSASDARSARGVVEQVARDGPTQQFNTPKASSILRSFDAEHATSLSRGPAQPSVELLQYRSRGEMDKAWFPVMRRLNRSGRLSPVPRDHAALRFRRERRAHSLNDVGYDTVSPRDTLPLWKRMAVASRFGARFPRAACRTGERCTCTGDCLRNYPGNGLCLPSLIWASTARCMSQVRAGSCWAMVGVPTT